MDVFAASFIAWLATPTGRTILYLEGAIIIVAAVLYLVYRHTTPSDDRRTISRPSASSKGIKLPPIPTIRNNKLLAGLYIGLTLLAISLYAGIGTRQAEAAWFDHGYSYRQLFTFTHNADISAQRRVTLSLDTAELITAGAMQSDCDDTRFTDINGAQLPYELTGTCNNAATTYEVVFPSIIDGTNSAYVYYGNPSAISASVGTSSITALTPSGGDPSITDRTSEEASPAPAGWWKFDEGVDNTCSGGTNDACDGTANANDAAMTGGTWQMEGSCISGKCMFFDGSDDVATITNAAPLDFDTGISAGVTFSTWIRVNSDGENDVGEIFDKGSSTYLRVTNEGSDGLADLEASIDLATTNATATITDGIVLNQWHHVAFSYTDDGDDELTIYIDGTTRATSTNGDGSPTSGDTNSLLIGGSSTANLHGFVDDFKVYDTERSASQIKLDAAAAGSVRGIAAGFGVRDPMAVTSEGLVGYWQMNETSADTCTGGSNDACDASGNGHDGAWGNDATNATGKFGSGVDYDGTADYISVTDSDDLEPTEDLTVSLWFNLDQLSSTKGDTQTLIVKDGSGGGPYYIHVDTDDDVQFGWRNTDSTLYTTTFHNSLTASEINTWLHVVGVKSDDTIYIYLNGIQGNSPTTTTGLGKTTTDPLYIGATDTTDNSTDGTIDEVRMYKRAFSPADVRNLYSWAPGPAGYWSLNENTGTTIYDYSGNGNNGTMEGGLDADDWRAGKYGSSLRFDGVQTGDGDTHIRLSDDIHDGHPQGTITAWIKPEDTGNAYQSIFNIGEDDNGGFSDYITMYYRPSTDGVEINIQDNDGTYEAWANTPSSVLDTDWHHIALTGGPNGNYFYIDGVQQSMSYTQGSASDTTWIDDISENTTSYTIGCSDFDGSDANDCYPNETFTGQIDEVKLYDYQLTSEQLIQDMNAGHPTGGSPVGSQSIYWRLDEQQGTTASDARGNTNGTITSATWLLEESCKIDACLNFDAASERVSIANASDSYVDFNGSETFSLSAWVYPVTMPGSGEQDAVIVKWDETATTRGYRLVLENDDADSTGNFQVELYDESANQAITASGANDTVSQNTWYHVVATFNGGTAGTAGDLALFVNGIQVDTNSANASFLGLEDVSADFTVGEYDPGDAVAANTAFTGRIDDVKVYASQLSQSEILIDMNANTSASFGSVLGSSEASLLTDGAGNPPILWYKLDENTGTGSDVILDSSGNGHSGTTVDLAESDWVPGKYGSGIDFERDDTEHVYADDDAQLSNLEDITVEAWIHVESFNGSDQSTIVAHAGASTSTREFDLVADSDGSFGVELFDASFHDGAAGGLTAGVWHHVAWTWDNSTSDLYIDGVHESSNSNSRTSDNSTGRVTFGARDLSNNGSSVDQYFDGIIDNVKIYNYKRTQAQVAYSYNRGKPVGWWKLDECQGSTAYDTGAASNDGTITIGGSGDNTSLGTCSSGTGTEAWNNGTTGKRNASLDFDGTDDYITVADDDALSFGDASTDQPFSLSAWVNMDDASSFQIANKAPDSGSTNHEWSWNLFSNDVMYLELFDNTTSGYIEVYTDSALTSYENSWVHLAATYTGSGTVGGVTLYVNGIPVSTDDDISGYTAMHDTTSTVKIGAYLISGGGSARYSNGQIDDFRLFNYTLSANQVKTIMNDSAQRFGPLEGSP